MSQNAVHPTAANEARLQAAARQRSQQNAPSLPFQASDTAEQQRFNGLLKQAEKVQNERAAAQKQANAEAQAQRAQARAEAKATSGELDTATSENAAATEADTEARRTDVAAQQADAALLAALTPVGATEGGAAGAVAGYDSTGTGMDAASAQALATGAEAALQAQDPVQDPNQAQNLLGAADAPDASEALTEDLALAQAPAREEARLQSSVQAERRETQDQQQQQLRGLERAREALASNPATQEPALERAAPLRDAAALLGAGLTPTVGTPASANGFGPLGAGTAGAAGALADASMAANGLEGNSASGNAGTGESGQGAGGSGTSNPDQGTAAGATGSTSTNTSGGQRTGGTEGFSALLNGAGTGAAQGASGAQGQAPGATQNPAQGMAQNLAPHMGDSFNQLGVQVSLWASQNLRRASLSLSGADGQPIDVDVTLKDGKASLAFRTDDSSARSALQNFGQQALSDMLGQHGLDLSGLSVDARASDTGRHANAQGQPAAPHATAAAARALRGLSGEGVSGAAQGLGWTSKTASSLDVYV